MANTSLPALTERTATANSDLIHVNSGGTDYKETKANFLSDVNASINSLNNSLANLIEYHNTDDIKANGWASNGISVYGKIGNLGFIQASIRNGTINSNLMTLPSGFRPSGVVVILVFSSSGANGYAVINTNGTVIPSAMSVQAAIFTAIYPLA